ncbi:7-deoxyloganetin glucosyltransferase-like [Mercurialis annua]|uniref:7-deoxyloganetin glucosyltransferase-like n=1 Tax=Mercurialis annua TaxID=3986 RepID=UPI0021603F03|nr:7-deoxyloganetin glucosyltransferase-like [Mercurialis annua]
MSKPHVVCVPFPLQGHINPMLKLAKLLHSKGFHVTFVNTEFNHNRILDSRGPNALNGLPDFHFATIPLPHPPSNSNTTLNLRALHETCRKDFLNLFRHLVGELNNTVSNPPVTCVISDAVLNYSVTLSEDLQIPVVLFWSMGASGFMSLKHFHDQIKQFIAFLKDPSIGAAGMEKNLDSLMEWIPGMKGAKVRDLSEFSKTKDEINVMEDSSKGGRERDSMASAIIFHTFDALESQILKDVAAFFKRVFSISPLQLFLDQIPDEQYSSIECNLWNEDAGCIKWLDSKQPNSVIYVNFGSITVMTVEQVVELAWGLANSNHNFLWITRPDLIMGESAILPPEFLTETKGRGFIASWCPQEEILNHPSTAGFLTHCGWNSILETISSGTPIICWPFFGEHFVNSRKSCGEWGIGMELASDFRRDDVEKLVKVLMEEEKGKMMKEKALEWKKLAEESVNSNGSSSLNFNYLVNEILLS